MPQNRGKGNNAGFVEFAFQDSCPAKERVLTNRVFIAFATQLFPSTEGSVPLFYTNWCRAKVRNSNGLVTIATKQQPGSWGEVPPPPMKSTEDMERISERTGALNWLLESTYTTAIGMTGIRSYFTGSAEETPREKLEESAIVFAIVRNDDQKRVKTRGKKTTEASPFTTFLKTWSLTGEDAKHRMEEKVSVPFMVDHLDEDLLKKMRGNIEDLIVFARGEKEVRGWYEASQFFVSKDQFKFLVLPMVGDSRSIPQGLSINRVGDDWVYSTPTPGAVNIPTQVAVQEEAFDVSGLTCPSDTIAITSQVSAVAVIEGLVANQLRRQRIVQLEEEKEKEEEEEDKRTEDEDTVSVLAGDVEGEEEETGEDDSEDDGCTTMEGDEQTDAERRLVESTLRRLVESN